MNTTAVFIEILIVGIEAAVWIVLGIFTFFGTGALKADLFDGWQTLATFVFLSLVYVLGIVIDRVSDTLYKWFRDDTRPGAWVRRTFGQQPGERPAKVSLMRLALMERDDGRTRFLDYQRSRLRIARASVFNLVMVLPASIAFAFKRTDLGWPRSVGLAVPILFFLVVTLFAAERIGDAYIERLIEAYEMLTRETDMSRRRQRRNNGDDADTDATGTSARDRCLRAAAVCYRDRDGPEFLLVTTKDRKKWVFPKGRLEEGEHPWEAAEREAREEAGAMGEVDTGRLTSYVFPSKKDGCGELHVLAYLLQVDQVVRPTKKERQRDRRWFDPDDARRALDEAHGQVIDAALERLAADRGGSAQEPAS